MTVADIIAAAASGGRITSATIEGSSPDDVLDRVRQLVDAGLFVEIAPMWRRFWSGGREYACYWAALKDENGSSIKVSTKPATEVPGMHLCWCEGCCR